MKVYLVMVLIHGLCFVNDRFLQSRFLFEQRFGRYFLDTIIILIYFTS